ncbi:cupin domain-containing protein [Sphingorhabdus sp.]|uniref:cupin domain-containing protein n=1 Tax=Sphingorhabdus sp. TaxID=1902408 RepID=UPI00391B5AAE
MPKIDIEAITQSNETGYPAPYNAEVEGRWWRRLAPEAGLTKLGASHVVLKPGGWSSHRHWHRGEDELVIMLSGEAVLVEDSGETILQAGDVAAWPAGVPNGHHLINRSVQDCVFVAIGAGDRTAGGVYADINMTFSETGYFRKDGTPYSAERIK